jgi:transposase
MVEGEGLGRSRSELSAKVHLTTDGRGLPLYLVLTGGQTGDNSHLLQALERNHVQRRVVGRPQSRPRAVVAAKAHSHPSTRTAMLQRKVQFISPQKSNQTRRRVSMGNRCERPPACDEELYRGRNVIERCFNRLKQFRDLATRYAKPCRLLPSRGAHHCDHPVASMIPRVGQSPTLGDSSSVRKSARPDIGYLRRWPQNSPR